VLVGAGGNDTFVFKFDTIDQVDVGLDTINDFSAGVGLGDVIELSGFGLDFDTFAELMTHTVNTGSGVRIYLNSDYIDLLGIVKSQLAVDDFAFV
jgi:Ca2+-binding RTX toxin-like protein